MRQLATHYSQSARFAQPSELTPFARLRRGFRVVALIRLFVLSVLSVLPAFATLSIFLISGSVQGAEIRVAVASNFANTLEELSFLFQKDTGHTLIISRGSSGKHFAQISNGAAFDLYLSADSDRPQRLVEAGRVDQAMLADYAVGQLALWSGENKLAGLVEFPPENFNLCAALDRQVLLKGDAVRHLAMANPRLAPYGRAAQETIESLAWSESLASRRVSGENVSQTYQFIYSGAAELGFIALAQLPLSDLEGSIGENYWIVPDCLHNPIRQSMVLLSDSNAARQLFDFIQGESASQIIKASGYKLPETLPASIVVASTKVTSTTGAAQ